MTVPAQGLEPTPPARPDSLRRAHPKLPESPFTLWIIGLVVLGVAARVAFYTSRFGRFDSDEAVGGLMARDVLHGHLTAFYWGQGYGGPLETWLAAPLVSLFGSGWIELRLIPITCCAVASLATWRVGLRTIGRAGALTAGALFWFFPMTLLWRTTNFYVIYAGSTMLGIVTVLQVLRMWERPTRRGMFILGLVAGVGIWQSFQLVTIVPTAIAWLLIRRRGALAQLPVMLVGAAIGLLPVLGSNVRHDWWSARTGHSATELHYLGRLGQFFTNGLPVALDLRVPLTLDWFLWRPVAFVLYGLVIVALLWLGWSSQARRERRGSEVLLAILVAFPFIYAISPLTTFKLHSGYVVVLAPILMLGLCAWIRSEAQAILTSVVAIALLAHSFVGLGVFLSRPGPEYPTSFYADQAPLPRDLRPLLDRLDSLKLRRVYASYWIAHRITYESGGHILAADIRPEALRTTNDGYVIPLPGDTSNRSRHPAYGPIVDRVPAPAFVLDKSFDIASTDYDAFARAHYRMEEVGPFTIYYDGAASQGIGASRAPVRKLA